MCILMCVEINGTNALSQAAAIIANAKGFDVAACEIAAAITTVRRILGAII